MTERQFRIQVVSLLKRLGAFPVENSVGAPGTPDIATSVGWIELKIARNPAKYDSPIRPGMRPSQRVWHKRWARSGGVSWALTLVDDREWILHDGVTASEIYDESVVTYFRALAIEIWSKKPSQIDFTSTLIDDAITRQKAMRDADQD